MKDFFQALGYIFLFIIAVIGAVMFVAVVVWFAAVILAFFIVFWAVGFRWNVYREKELIGHVRWFTFYPKRVADTVDVPGQ